MHKYFQGFDRFRDAGLPTKLPNAVKRALGDDTELRRLTEVVNRLRDLGSSDDLQRAQVELRTYRTWQARAALIDYRKTWITSNV